MIRPEDLISSHECTPTPWRLEWSKKSPTLEIYGANDYFIGRIPVHLCVGDDDEKNAAFIIRAVNAYVE